MSKAQYIFLAVYVGANAVLCTYLLMRACASYYRALRPALPEIGKVAVKSAAVLRRQAWTTAVWRERVAPKVQAVRPAVPTLVQTTSHRVLC